MGRNISVSPPINVIKRDYIKAKLCVIIKHAVIKKK